MEKSAYEKTISIASADKEELKVFRHPSEGSRLGAGGPE
jgi:hypothetical protein